MYEYSPDGFRCIFPALRKIAFWVRANRTFDGAIPWLCCVNTSGVMAAACSFKHFDMPKNSDNGEKLMVSVLDNISDGIDLSYRDTYLYTVDSGVISLVVERMIEVKGRNFALEAEKLKCVQNVERESCLRTIKRGREPRSCQKLVAWMWSPKASTESECYCMNPTDVDDCEIFDRMFGIRTRAAFVARLNSESEMLQGDISEVCTIPLL
jgi:hypothetical protein